MPDHSNPWIDLPVRPPYVALRDAATINAITKNKDVRFELRLDVLPEPFIGSPTAPVVLLGLNPGFDDLNVQEHKHPDFQKKLRQNYRHEPADYPFYYLDPVVRCSGQEWWEAKLKFLYQDDAECRMRVARSILCVEYFPYHSIRFNHSRIEVPSQEYGFSLVRSAIERKAIIVLMRSRRLWMKSVPELNGYPHLLFLVNPQNPTVSGGNFLEDGFSRVEGRDALAAYEPGTVSMDARLGVSVGNQLEWGVAPPVAARLS